MKKILIIKTSSLGDLFHALPTVRALKEQLDAKIHWVANAMYVPLVKCFDDVDRVIPFPRDNFLTQLAGFRSQVRAEQYDYVIDLQGLLKSAIVAWFAKSKKRIGPSFHREGSHWFYHAVAGPRNKERHAVDECLDVVRYLGLHVPERAEFRVTFPKIDLETPHPRVGLLPCSRWETKNWPAEHFIATGKALAAAGAHVFLLGAPDDKPVCSRIEQGIGAGVRNLCAKTRLVDLGGVMNELDLLISVDSGPMHMAAAVGTPVIAPFGATEPKRTGPYGRHLVLVNENLSCRPCLSRTCLRSQKDIACLRDLPPDRVISAARQVLGI